MALKVFCWKVRDAMSRGIQLDWLAFPGARDICSTLIWSQHVDHPLSMHASFQHVHLNLVNVLFNKSKRATAGILGKALVCKLLVVLLFQRPGLLVIPILLANADPLPFVGVTEVGQFAGGLH